MNEPWLYTGQAGMVYFLHHDREVLADSLAVLHRLEDVVELHDIWPHFGPACRAAETPTAVISTVAASIRSPAV